MKCDQCDQPAIYGDGVTWARCAKHQLEATKDEPVPQEPEIAGEGVPHQRIENLTSIIIPIHMKDYSLFHMTGNCIGSVREHTDQQTDPYELIIIDNGSPVQPPNLQSYYGQKVIKWEENKGVSKAWNAGIRVSFGDYIVLLNNDAQVYQGWLPVMKKCLDNGLDLVMAKPMYSLTEPFARATEAYKEQERWVNKPVTESFDKTGPTDFACVMFKKELVDQLGFEGVGLFDERFFAYCSDIDLLKRMDEKGLKYAVCKAVPIHHIIDATGNTISETPEIMNKDKAEFQEKWSKPQTQEPKTFDEALAPATVAILNEPKEEQKSEIPLIRVENGGDAVYLVKDQNVHWITTLEVLKALGYDLGQEKWISKDEFAKYTRGENINSFNIEKFK